MIAKMNVLLDKNVYEKTRMLVKPEQANEIVNADQELTGMHAGVEVKKALLDSLVNGKVGSLSVDPNYLDFESLECKNWI